MLAISTRDVAFKFPFGHSPELSDFWSITLLTFEDPLATREWMRIHLPTSRLGPCVFKQGFSSAFPPHDLDLFSTQYQHLPVVKTTSYQHIHSLSALDHFQVHVLATTTCLTQHCVLCLHKESRTISEKTLAMSNMDSNAVTIDTTITVPTTLAATPDDPVGLPLSTTAPRLEGEARNRGPDMELKTGTTTSSDEEGLSRSIKHQITESDSTVPMEGAIFKHSGEEFEVQGSYLPRTLVIVDLIQTEDNSEIEHAKANISTLSTELALRIFKFLQKCSATCLSLTCRRLYSCLKDQYPEPICLRCTECCGMQCYPSIGAHPYWSSGCCKNKSGEHSNHTVALGEFIKPWMGPRYTLVYIDLEVGYPIFVRSVVY
jgi:hypothetical protein